MKNRKPRLSDDDLHRFIDGELNEADSRAAADYIADDDGLRNKADEYREINRRLREFYGDEQAVPARLLLAASPRNGLPLGRFAAALVWVIVGGVIGYSLQGRLGVDGYLRPLAVEAAYAHAVFVPEVRHPVEVSVDQKEHLNAWLSKRLNRPISAPDLRSAGYALIGGRLLPDGHRPAAQFMFEDDAGQRITLYIRHALDTRETSFRHAQEEELGIVYWVDEGLAYALIAAAGRDELIAAARIVYQEANPE
jgi:anti-sigma factor RsiW